jgi:16S rRNA (uracil1498-N3)-methyltransferase
MRTPRFYCADLDSIGSTVQLPDQVHRHAIQVLRMKVGEHLRLFDGQGFEAQAEVIEISKRESKVKLLNQLELQNESPLKTTLLQAISKGERMDYALQKAVELGVSKIIPVITERCNVQLSKERMQKRLAHWQGVIISACEQSGRASLPQLEQVHSLSDLLLSTSFENGIVLDPQSQQSLSMLTPQQSVTLLIGPEGGFSEQEVAMATDAGFQSVRFGPRILRTETATVAALSVIQSLWGDMQ